MSQLVEVYGLRVLSPLPLPAPAAQPTDSPPDVVIHVGARPTGADRWSEAGTHRVYESETEVDGHPVLVADRPDGATLRLRYAEGIRFHIAKGGAEVWTDWSAPLTEADAVTFLLGPVLGAVLRERGVLVLHASALVMGGRAWAFVGPAGVGKSTLVAAGAASGVAVLTEDVLALERTGADWFAKPAYEQIRLWDEGAGLVTAPGETLPTLTPTWPKRAFDLAARGSVRVTEPTPLGGIFVLGDRDAGGARPRIEALSATEALTELLAHGYVNYLLDLTAQGRELPALAALAHDLPVRRLVVGSGRAGLESTLALLASITP